MLVREAQVSLQISCRLLGEARVSLQMTCKLLGESQTSLQDLHARAQDWQAYERVLETGKLLGGSETSVLMTCRLPDMYNIMSSRRVERDAQ